MRKNEKNKIVILDGCVANPGDIDWSPIENIGDVLIYNETANHEIVERAKNAEIIVTNKCVLDRSTIGQLPKLKCICVIATGYNNIDVEAAKEAGIIVCNVKNYGTSSVAQHVFALILELSNQTGRHSQGIHRGEWKEKGQWSYWLKPVVGLEGKTMGVYGFGAIGKAVAKLALAYGMKVMVTTRQGRAMLPDEVDKVNLQTLFEMSDVLSLHVQLTSDNEGQIDASLMNVMKSSAFLINTARGGLINEMDLRQALLSSKIAGAGLDVLSQEPPDSGHPLLGLDNCILTPHMAWATKEARQMLIDLTAQNIKAYLKGNPLNQV